MVMDNTTDSIVNLIMEANSAYRAGNPIMTDQEYDDLLESLKPHITEDEYEDFVNSLNEGSIEKNVDGKVKHPFIMGSLEKLKAEEPDVATKWIDENCGTHMLISAKVDGISSRAEYKNGKLVSLTTRGDGYFGLDCTSKMKYIKGLHAQIPNGFTGNIRGELVIFKNDFETIKHEFSNRRNACAGIMNRKDGDKKFNEDELRLVSFIPYTYIPDNCNISKKQMEFDNLELAGFNVAEHVIIAIKDGGTGKSFGEENIGMLHYYVNQWIKNLPYEIDGLVICDPSWKNEVDKYRPDGCKAWKLNQSIGITKIVGFDWGTPSSNGKMTPVALLEPIELAGAMISRVTCNNISWLEGIGAEIGKTVKVIRSGEVIPKILEVLD